MIIGTYINLSAIVVSLIRTQMFEKDQPTDRSLKVQALVSIFFRDQYESYDFAAELKKFKDTGDTTRMAMMLQVHF